ncbi:CRAL/TRIO domain-containing protein [Basidiobolus meristosporus CBS 931.73]|uniref:CRAL/TRIO domain-containing protein n=1 Tax=Basidiobolus meristosporus CBS 931.73 TaxID=1314790 RepID=A0A1Y1YR91_9FUNG|nr:CRAL/TRIO domain-containing protein [Basidiobolus meristosporus CBS 931.73]|eukprot:ORY00499.1 CRAL/TRIO domain-containing protein [Basidiobolus meristosporus CBS 931.73]
MSNTETGYLNNLTELQAEALESLRVRVVEELPNADLSADDLTIWGVSLENLEQLSKVQKIVFLKFLRARDFKVDLSLRMLLDTLKWRKEFNINSLMKESFPEEIQELGYIHKTDINGGPVTYNIYGNLKADKVFDADGTPTRFVRWRVQLMERAIALLDFENGVEAMTQVHDYHGASLFRMDRRMKTASSQIIQLFQDHYPEFLDRKLFVNVPGLMEMLFNLMSVFVSARTKSKFLMVGQANTQKTLLTYISKENLPTQYGGDSQLHTI